MRTVGRSCYMEGCCDVAIINNERIINCSDYKNRYDDDERGGHELNRAKADTLDYVSFVLCYTCCMIIVIMIGTTRGVQSHVIIVRAGCILLPYDVTMGSIASLNET